MRSGLSELAVGRAYVDASGWRTIAVAGRDAARWLNDLASADLSGLEPGRARPSLLLSPTGGVLASFVVTITDEGYLLTQDPDQRSVGELLGRYVLSSDVRLDDRTGAWTILAFPGRGASLQVPDASWSSPTCLGGDTGGDLWSAAGERDRLRAALGDPPAASDADAETWRVLMAVPKLGVDTADSDLPHECGLASAVSFDKGCYLGQEAVARSRSLGRPRRLVEAVEADRAIAPGEPLFAGDEEAGVVTSATSVDGGHLAIARIGWAHRDAAWTTPAGAQVTRRAGTGQDQA